MRAVSTVIVAPIIPERFPPKAGSCISYDHVLRRSIWRGKTYPLLKGRATLVIWDLQRRLFPPVPNRDIRVATFYGKNDVPLLRQLAMYGLSLAQGRDDQEPEGARP